MVTDFGPDALVFPIACGRAWVVSSAAGIPAELRGAALRGRNKDFRYYHLIEDTLSAQFDHRYFVLHDEVSGEWAIQPFFFVKQDLLAGLPQAVRALVAPLR